nr:GAF domain-containing sensor histidine kinase [Candidatus Solirubrobacter pratensis]
MARFRSHDDGVGQSDEVHGDSRFLAEEQGALRRVATSVAHGSAPGEVFAVLAREFAQLLHVPLIVMVRFGPDRTGYVVGAYGDPPFPVGSSWPLDPRSVMAQVYATGRPARVDDYSQLDGVVGKVARAARFHSTVGVPIVVAGKTWGATIAITIGDDSLPADTARRLADFTDLVAAAISNTEARDELRVLADEQAALRRLATLVAEGSRPAAVFAAAAEEVAKVLDVRIVDLLRYEPDDAVTVVAGWGEVPFPIGSRFPLDGPSIASKIKATREAQRIDDYSGNPSALGSSVDRAGIRTGVGVPVSVDGKLWGVMAIGSRAPDPLPSTTEERLRDFVELLAVAIANSEARHGLRKLADEQDALRRLATLVAQGAPSHAVFDAVCEEAARIIGSSTVNLARFAPAGCTTTVAGWSRDGSHVPAGVCLPMEGEVINVIVQRERAPGRVEDYADVEGELAALLRRLGVRTEIGAPVIVDGEVWGALIAGLREGTFPRRSEQRVAGFAELIATAVSNADTRAELLASRARLVTAADEGRRKLARDIHDGAQQRLVTAIVSLQLADRQLDTDPEGARTLLRDALSQSRAGLDELRELATGMHPAILTNSGLRAAIEALAQRSRVPVNVRATSQRLPSHIEAGAYFLIAEALTNASKHARASRVEVVIRAREGVLEIEVFDDGVGGADPHGSGVRGLEDRVEALGGTFRIESPEGRGTAIHATLPLLSD